jgi:hypothetical protein
MDADKPQGLLDALLSGGPNDRDQALGLEDPEHAAMQAGLVPTGWNEAERLRKHEDECHEAGSGVLHT